MTTACCNRSEVIDPNENQIRPLPSRPLGSWKAHSFAGQSTTEGDQDRPGVRMEFGFPAFEDSSPENRQPIFVRYHPPDPSRHRNGCALPERDETITTVEYSDGFGRLLQTRTQGEEVRFGDEHFGGGETLLPVKQSDGAGGDVVGRRKTDLLNPNVVVSGWQIYDNKGQIVEKYEPFFSEGWDYG